MSLCQNDDFDKGLFSSYEQFREKSLDKLRVKHADIQPLIEHIGSHKGFEVKQLGTSMEGRSISMISVGTGKIDILLWSQMHGDEPTATLAIFDLLNFFADDSAYKKEKKALLKAVRVAFRANAKPRWGRGVQKKKCFGYRYQ